MKKTTLEVKFKILVHTDEDTDLSEFVNEMEYYFNDTTTKTDIVETELVDFSVIDSR